MPNNTLFEAGALFNFRNGAGFTQIRIIRFSLANSSEANGVINTTLALRNNIGRRISQVGKVRDMRQRQTCSPVLCELVYLRYQSLVLFNSDSGSLWREQILLSRSKSPPGFAVLSSNTALKG